MGIYILREDKILHTWAQISYDLSDVEDNRHFWNNRSKNYPSRSYIYNMVLKGL